MQTIGDVFSIDDWNENYRNPENVLGLMEFVGYGAFQRKLSPDLYRFKHWAELIAEVHKSVDERAALPSRAFAYVQIMNSAKDRFNHRHARERIQAPPCWLATITTLKKTVIAEEVFPDKIESF